MIRWLLIFLFTLTYSQGSTQRLPNYADQLFFGILSYNPDTSIKEFVEKFIPVLYKKFDSGGTWTMYPPNFKEPEFITVTSSYIFNSHPHLRAKFKLGQLAVTQKLYKESKWDASITEVKLWFEFDDLKTANYCYKTLVDTCSTFKVLKRITSFKGISKAEFTDKNAEEYYSSIQIILIRDYSIGQKYAQGSVKEPKVFREPGYRVLVEIGNDLY